MTDKDQVRSTEEALSLEQTLRLALEALESNRRTHYYCEDTWYSCPKHEDGCANDSEGDECNCGADEVNAEIDQAITAIKAALEAKNEKPCPEFWDWLPKAYRDGDIGDEPRFTKYNMEVAFLAGKQSAALEAKDEPVAWYLQGLNQRGVSLKKETQEWKPLYTTSPQRAWFGLTDDEIEMIVENRRAAHWEFVRQVEAKLKEKNSYD